MDKGLIFDLKRYAINDGPGVRTAVFFKGCPLRCKWCHNPEGQSPEPEIILREKRCQEECVECLSICPQRALSKQGKKIKIERQKCDLCGKCATVCIYRALEIVGREISVKELLEEVLKDMVFFDQSKGGITFSGGEPLFQPNFLETTLREFKKRGVHTAVDTAGYVSFEIFEMIVDKVDLFLYDIKLMGESKHKKYTGVSNRLILRNLERIVSLGKEVIVRLPLIHGVNDDSQNIHEISKYLLSLKRINEIHLLPYHRGGEGKYRSLGKRISFQGRFEPPPDESLKEIKERLKDRGFSVKIGG